MRSTQRMPAGHHYAITTAVRTEFFGMTTALLFRSRSFVEQTGTTVTVLTYDDHRDYDKVRRKLTASGRLADGVRLLNLFEDMATWDQEQLGRAIPSLDPELSGRFVEPAAMPAPRGRPFSVVRDADATILAVNRYRPDGTVVISGRRDVEGHDRVYTLFDHDEVAIGTWASERALVHFWLDTLPRDPVAWFIVDSKTSANSLVHYRRADVVTMHLVHNTHLETTRDGTEKLNSRGYVMQRLDDFDAVIFLTPTQLEDVNRLMGEGIGNRYSIGNVCIVPGRPPRGRRPRRRGVVVGRLDGVKRINHAIGAVIANQDVINPLHRPYLDVYGTGDRRDALARQIEKGRRRRRRAFTRFLSRILGRRVGRAIGLRVDRIPLRPSARLNGYDADARAQFAAATFSMVTSRSEGFALTVVEAMGHGCIPISYDLPYGPGDIVTHGVNGLLVPYDDRKALAAAVRRVMTMSRADRRAMRQAAFARAQDFDGPHITAQWIKTMHQALAAKRGRAEAGS